MRQLERLERLRLIALEIARECARIRAELTPTCTHPEKYRNMGKWEWDNGYGTQKWLSRWWCDICGYEVKLYV